MLEVDQKEGNTRFFPQSVEDYEREARKHLSDRLIDYIYRGTESQFTLNRNVSAFSKYVLRRRVLNGIRKVDLSCSYFDDRIKSEVPFFPAPVNTSPISADALASIIRASEGFSVPIFISHVAVVQPYELSKLPSLVSPKKSSSLIWQIYMLGDNVEDCYKQAKLAQSWGYSGLAITVDAELNVKIGNEIPPELSSRSFFSVTPKEIRRLRECSTLPLIAKGVMTPEDAELALESGADGVVVSNHGARTLDRGQAPIEVLSGIVKHLRSKKKTRRAEIFLDGGIRRGTDVLIALALGAKGCLIGRPTLWSLACDRENGVANMMSILRSELQRAATLCGVSKVSAVRPSTVTRADS